MRAAAPGVGPIARQWVRVRRAVRTARPGACSNRPANGPGPPAATGAARAAKRRDRRREMPPARCKMPQLRPKALHFTTEMLRFGASALHFIGEMLRFRASARHFISEMLRMGTRLRRFSSCLFQIRVHGFQKRGRGAQKTPVVAVNRRAQSDVRARFRSDRARAGAWRGLKKRAITDKNYGPPEVAKWQTRGIQNPVPARE